MKSSQILSSEALTIRLEPAGMDDEATAHPNIHGDEITMQDGPVLTRTILPSGMQPGRTGKSGIRGVRPSKSPSTFLTADS